MSENLWITFRLVVACGKCALDIVIHPRAILGDYVVSSHGVVIGGKNCRSEVPRIRDNAYVGTGTKIL
jgi:serine acetyltransferase